MLLICYLMLLKTCLYAQYIGKAKQTKMLEFGAEKCLLPDQAKIGWLVL